MLRPQREPVVHYHRVVMADPQRDRRNTNVLVKMVPTSQVDLPTVCGVIASLIAPTHGTPVAVNRMVAAVAVAQDIMVAAVLGLFGPTVLLEAVVVPLMVLHSLIPIRLPQALGKAQEILTVPVLEPVVIDDIPTPPLLHMVRMVALNSIGRFG